MEAFVWSRMRRPIARELQEKPVVVVSNHWNADSKSRDVSEICDILTVYDYTPHVTGTRWPRDKYTSYNNKFVSKGFHGSLGIGGNFVFGDGYGIVSRNIFPSVRRTDLDALEAFFEIPIYPVFGYKYTKTRHMDMTVLPIPQLDLLLVDERHYEYNASQFERIAQEHAQELIVVTPHKDEAEYFPLNSLVLDFRGEPVVIANSLTPHFLGLLDDLLIHYESVPCTDAPRLSGSIRCRTNTAPHPNIIAYNMRVTNWKY